MSRTSREASGNGAGQARCPLFAVAEGWVEKRLPNVEASINQVIGEFCGNPYLHRVEYSLHCELYGHLVVSGELGETQNYGLFARGAYRRSGHRIAPDTGLEIPQAWVFRFGGSGSPQRRDAFITRSRELSAWPHQTRFRDQDRTRLWPWPLES